MSEVTLTEKSRVTLALCLAIAGTVFWVGVAWGQLKDLEKRMSALESIDQRLSRIEGKLGVGP